MLIIKNLDELNSLLLLQEKERTLNNSNNVLIYVMDMNYFSDSIALLWQHLDYDEQEKAIRYYKPIDKERYIISRGVLRYLLGFFMKSTPKTIMFAYNKFGKPFVKNHSIQFNLSHSKNLIIYAFNSKQSVGVDLEFCCKKIDSYSLSNILMTEKELHRFKRLNSIQDKVHLFYKLWTKKESIVKFMGHGLHYPINRIETSELNTDNIILNNRELYCHSFTINSNFLGAITVGAKLNQYIN